MNLDRLSNVDRMTDEVDALQLDEPEELPPDWYVPGGDLVMPLYRYRHPSTGRDDAFVVGRFKLHRPDKHGNTKTFRQAHRCDPRSRCDRCASGRWHLSKPDGAAGYLYRLPEVVRGIDAGAEIWSVEGEKDADACAGVGLVATSHHGGAEKFAIAQAYKLRDARQVILVMDRDGPGALDVIRRYDKLRQVGLLGRALVIVRAFGPLANKDASDHLEAGYGPDDFVRRAVADVRDEARAEAAARPSRSVRVRRYWGGA